MNFEIETRDDERNELVEKVYTFSYAKQWDRWTFQEFVERRTSDTKMMKDRNWRKTRELFWHDVHETPDVEVPPEVTDRLAMATGSESVVIQTPSEKVVEESNVSTQ